jgi:uncharacterized protein YndB with AHSA1/START domain
LTTGGTEPSDAELVVPFDSPAAGAEVRAEEVGMVRVEFTVSVERSPSEVFAYLTDIANLPEWQSSAIEASADGPIGIGTRITEVRKFLVGVLNTVEQRH